MPNQLKWRNFVVTSSCWMVVNLILMMSESESCVIEVDVDQYHHLNRRAPRWFEDLVSDAVVMGSAMPNQLKWRNFVATSSFWIVVNLILMVSESDSCVIEVDVEEIDQQHPILRALRWLACLAFGAVVRGSYWMVGDLNLRSEPELCIIEIEEIDQKQHLPNRRIPEWLANSVPAAAGTVVFVPLKPNRLK